MADNTKIEWTDATVNFWWGCSKVSLGCDHCYAETWSKRTGENIWGVGVPRRKIKSAVATMFRLHNGYAWWAADCQIGKLHPNSRRRVFTQSMSDLLDLEVPLEWFAEAWQTITDCHWLDIQIVTKRVSVVEKRLAAIDANWPNHAGLIISVVNQAEADRDIPRQIALKHKLGIPWIGLSMEPLLGGVVLRPEWLEHLDWVIVGGESGAGARPMHPDWVRSLRDQCAAAGVPFFFKQWGEWAPTPSEPPGTPGQYALAPATRFHSDFWPAYPIQISAYPRQIDLFGGASVLKRIGKKRAGNLLDGRQHLKFPA